jgi:hypothetical protein
MKDREVAYLTSMVFCVHVIDRSTTTKQISTPFFRPTDVQCFRGFFFFTKCGALISRPLDDRNGTERQAKVSASRPRASAFGSSPATRNPDPASHTRQGSDVVVVRNHGVHLNLAGRGIVMSFVLLSSTPSSYPSSVCTIFYHTLLRQSASRPIESQPKRR